jgi:hypothetical protein
LEVARQGLGGAVALVMLDLVAVLYLLAKQCLLVKIIQLLLVGEVQVMVLLTVTVKGVLRLP